MGTGGTFEMVTDNWETFWITWSLGQFEENVKWRSNVFCAARIEIARSVYFVRRGDNTGLFISL